jgi:hypothetical protein
MTKFNRLQSFHFNAVKINDDRSKRNTHGGKFVGADKKYRLESFQLEDLGLEKTDWDAIDFNKPGSALNESNSCGSFLTLWMHNTAH